MSHQKEIVDFNGYTSEDRLRRLVFEQLKGIKNLHVAKPFFIPIGPNAGIIDSQVDNFFKAVPQPEPLIEELNRINQDYAQKRGHFVEIDSNFLFYIFVDPEVSKKFRQAHLRTCHDYATALRSANPIQIGNEYIFDIGVVPKKGIATTPVLEHNIHGARRERSFSYPWKFQTLAEVHAHPPALRSRVLRPSVVDKKKGEFVGDLHCFLDTRKRDEEYGWRTKRVLEIILQFDCEQNMVKMLLLRESKFLANLDYVTYFFYCKQIKTLFMLPKHKKKY